MTVVGYQGNKVSEQEPATPLPTPVAKPRRAATVTTSASQGGKKPSPVLMVSLVLIGVLVGGAAGIQAMRLRNQARKALVSVNGIVINQDELFPRLERAAGKQGMTKMIQETLQLQYAKSKGVVPTQAQIESRYAEFAKRPNFEVNNAARNIYPEDVKQQLRIVIAKEGVLSKGLTATDAEVKSFYQKNVKPKNTNALFYEPESIRMAVIVTPTQEQARVALRELDKGIPFGTVARNHSKDPSAVSGGYLNPVKRGRTPSSRIPGMEDAIFGLKIGQRLGPRQFAGTWWIIECVDKTAAVTQPFETVKEECRRQVLFAKGKALRGKQVDEEFNSFTEKASIKAFHDFYKPVVETGSGK